MYLYLDDVLVSAQVGVGLLAEETVGSAQWAGLLESVQPHAGRAQAAPGAGRDQPDRRGGREQQLNREAVHVGRGRRPADGSRPSPTPRHVPEPLTLPNLVPGWRLDWDGPIMVSHELGTFRNSPLTTDMTLTWTWWSTTRAPWCRDRPRPSPSTCTWTAFMAHTFELRGCHAPQRPVVVGGLGRPRRRGRYRRGRSTR